MSLPNSDLLHSTLLHLPPFLNSLLFCPHLPPFSTNSPPWLMDPAPPQAAEQRESPTASPSSSSTAMPSSQGSANIASGIMGKHRLSAAISFLNQQIQIIQDELDELETIGGVSTVCPDLISSIDSVPDALLPETRGPAEVGWDRWFQGAQSSRNRRRWI